MKIRFRAAAALLLLAIAGSCGDATLPDDVGVFAFQYSGAISGTFAARGRFGPDSTYAVGQVWDTDLSARGELRDARQSALAGVGVSGATRTGTYPLGTVIAPGKANGAFTIGFRDGSRGGFFRFTGGTLEITLVGDRRLRGRFNGTLTGDDNSTLTVTGGSFDVPAIVLDGFDGSVSVPR